MVRNIILLKLTLVQDCVLQGDEYETFKSNFAKNDEKLTEFAHKMKDFKGEETYIEFINKVIWLYFELFQQA